MKQLLSFALLWLASMQLFALDANFKHAVFYEPEYGAYVETHMLFYGSSFIYAEKADSSYQSNVELTYIFSQGGKIVDFSKNIVSGPLIADTLNGVLDFVDQQRFVLAPGSYSLTIKLKDANNAADSATLSQNISVVIPPSSAFFSDIFLANSATETAKPTIFSRAGYDLVPKVSNFYSPEDEVLSCYVELYQTDLKPGENEAFLLSIDIIDLETKAPLNEFHFIQKQTGQVQIPILKRFNIEDLPSGNYELKFEARDRSNMPIASKSIQIMRLNKSIPPDSLDSNALNKTFVSKFTSIDSLRVMTYCLRSRSEPYEENFIDDGLDTADMEQLQRFFYGFWFDRDPIAPESAWKIYHEDVAAVLKEYSTSRNPGCATDMGRVYLEYGKPDAIVARPNTAAFLPYEVWHYYATRRKANAKFVFYDTTRGTGTGYSLLHSNVPGEQADIQWFYRLQLNGMPNTVDEVAAFDTYGVNPVEDYNLPP